MTPNPAIADKLIRAVPKDQSLFLIDASIYIFRAWYGIPDRFYNKQGVPVNAVYGFIRFLLEWMMLAKPQYCVAAFDESLFSGFRHKLYPEYKANRSLPDPDLAFQLESCKKVMEIVGIPSVASPVYEADDLIASLASKARSKGMRAIVLSRDKDLMQVIMPNDLFWDYTEKSCFDQYELTEQLGFKPALIPDFLALMGDKVDNIPGLPGVGRVAALQLVSKIGGLESIYANLAAVETLSFRGAKLLAKKLSMLQEEVFLYRELTKACDQAPVSIARHAIAVKPIDFAALADYVIELGLSKVLAKPMAACRPPP